MLVRAHSTEILKTIWEYIDNDPTLAEIYLLVDGVRTQKEIVAALKDRGITLDQSNVSRKLGKLMNALSLVEISDRDATGATLRKSDLDKILNLTPKVERRLAALRKEKAKQVQERKANTKK
jgi:hypothetical protein